MFEEMYGKLLARFDTLPFRGDDILLQRYDYRECSGAIFASRTGQAVNGRNMDVVVCYSMRQRQRRNN